MGERQRAEGDLQKRLITGEWRRPTVEQQMCQTEQEGEKNMIVNKQHAATLTGE